VREGLPRVVSGDDMGFRADFNSGLIIFYKNRHPVGEMQAIFQVEPIFVCSPRVLREGGGGRREGRRRQSVNQCAMVYRRREADLEASWRQREAGWEAAWRQPAGSLQTCFSLGGYGAPAMVNGLGPVGFEGFVFLFGWRDGVVGFGARV